MHQFKQSHKVYSQSLNRCFETNRPNEFEMGVKVLAEPIPLHNINADALARGAENFLYVNPHLTNKELYMPRILKNLEKNLQKLQQEAQPLLYAEDEEGDGR